MAYFHCLIGGGSSGGGYELTVTCDADFAGTTITATDGVTTLTQTCPSASPYEVVFEIPNGGEWTISGIISGQTYSASIDIPDSLELHSVPEGSTVLPTDDIQTWLACAGITDKSYTTLNEVLADSTTLLALISDNNASDYLVRSTTWASGITADSTAMTDIGANNYCADTLLADSTWATAICNSTYFESVLNAKVPTMTGDTTPSGVAYILPSNAGSGYEAYKAFDGDSSTMSAVSGTLPRRLGYQFIQPVNVKKVVAYSNYANTTGILRASNDNSTWEEIKILNHDSQTKEYIITESSEAFTYWEIESTQEYSWGSFDMYSLQFYGRTDV